MWSEHVDQSNFASTQTLESPREKESRPIQGGFPRFRWKERIPAKLMTTKTDRTKAAGSLFKVQLEASAI